MRGTDNPVVQERAPEVRIDARVVEAQFRAMPVTDVKAVKSVIKKFREKYGAKDIKKYYSKFDVVVLMDSAELRLAS